MADYYRPPKRFWGSLELRDKYKSKIMGVDRDGLPYVLDSEGPIMLKLRCGCGYEWEIAEDDFPGRKLLRSCGRPECRYTVPETGLAPIRGAHHSVYLSPADTAAVAQVASGYNVSFSRAIAILLRRALLAMESVNPDTEP